MADRVPTSQSQKIELEEAGLGEKVVSINLDCSAEGFNQAVLEAYPKLKCSGGYELLRCRPQSRDLILIGPRIANNPKLLKRQVGNGKVYVRPIQRDLDLDETYSEEVDGVSGKNCSPVLLVI